MDANRPDTDKTAKKERGRRSPAFSLNEAMKILAEINNKLGRGPFGQSAVAEALGHKSVSGPVQTKVGALTHYKLLERSGSGSYSMSQLALRILLPKNEEDYRSALVEAAGSPALYSDLLADYTGKALPQLLGNILVHNYGVLPNTASDVAATFRETVEFVGLLRHGVLQDKPAPNEGVVPLSGVNRSWNDTPKEPQVPGAQLEDEQAQQPELTDYRIPMSNKRSAVLRLPHALTKQDLDRIAKWLTAMEDVLIENS